MVVLRVAGLEPLSGVLPVRDKTLPTVIPCIDTTLRRFGAAPTHGLSDNEKRAAATSPDLAEYTRLSQRGTVVGIPLSIDVVVIARS